MRVVYSPKHQLHNPDTEIQQGVPLPMFEVPQRAEKIREVLEADDGFELAPPTEHGTAPIEAVHEPTMVEYLETAWRDWRTMSANPQAVPDTVLHRALRDLTRPTLDEVRRFTSRPGTLAIVVLPELVVSKWKHRLLHNQNALFVKRLFLFESNAVLSSVPFVGWGGIS